MGRQVAIESQRDIGDDAFGFFIFSRHLGCLLSLAEEIDAICHRKIIQNNHIF